jgi:hypothetical protein
LSGYFKNEKNKTKGKRWYEMPLHYILFYFIPLLFSNPNNGTLLYFIPFRSIPLYFINPNKALCYVWIDGIRWNRTERMK